MTANEDIKTPKVFISYSWSTPEHQDKILYWAKKLVSNGVDIVIDKWNLTPGQDKYTFMEKMVTDPDIDHVLLICDKKYADKANGKTGGVGTETQIISKKIYEQVSQTKFLPIITEVDKKGIPYLPVFLESRVYYDFSKDEAFENEYEKLLCLLFEQPVYEKPKLGTPPKHIFKSSSVVEQESSVDNLLKNAEITSLPEVQEYLDNLLEKYENFAVNHDLSIILDEEIVESINLFKPYRNQYIEHINTFINSSQSHVLIEHIHEFFSKAIVFHDMRGAGTFWQDQFDNFKFINYELFLYTIAILIKHKKTDEINFLLEEKYYCDTSLHGMKSYDYTEFGHYFRSLDEFRNNRLKLNRVSVAMDILHDRADVKGISFNDLMQSDVILSVRSVIRPHEFPWFPRTLVYKGRHGPLEIFFKAESKRHFDFIASILNISSKNELVEKIKAAEDKHELSKWRLGNFDSVNLSYLINLDNLYSEKST